jgi:flagellar L-ring protein FlgH
MMRQKIGSAALPVLAGLTLAGAALGQADVRIENNPAAAFYEWSLLSVKPPDPTTYKIHDLITILVVENSRWRSAQTLDTSKDTDISASLDAFVSAAELLNLRIEDGVGSPISLVDAAADKQFAGDGEFERRDRITDRITATVIDVKPNGVLVLEATRTLQVDDETTVLVLSGMCETRAVTDEGVIQSSQLANMTLSVQHEGELRGTTSKGWLTRAVEAIFPF